jgi:hypothetical protein
MNRSCSDCTERRGYYLDAETIRNQQERIRQLEAERDDAVAAYDAHMAAHDVWHEAEDIEYTRNRFAVLEKAKNERIAELEKALAERDELIRDMMYLHCPKPCGECDVPHDEELGCEFMVRAIDMGVEL